MDRTTVLFLCSIIQIKHYYGTKVNARNYQPIVFLVCILSKKVLFVMSAAKELQLKNGKTYTETGVFKRILFSI
jgi:hypothetical protein